ncbi:MAG: TlpA family protein disulfide reductase [Bacteroides sp.]|nr:TlpA family protein disulfide reductase [Bacteroides sp.]
MKGVWMAVCSLMTAVAATAQNFTVTATVPGMAQGCKVELRTEDEEVLAETLTDDGGFVLRGSVERPLLAELCVYDKPVYQDGEIPEERGVRLMVESNADITLKAACIDSIPLLYELGGSPLFLEPCVHVEGGQAQRHYQEWRDWIYNAERVRWQAEHLEWAWQFSGRRSKNDGDGHLHEMMDDAVSAVRAIENRMNTLFIERHPDYAVSLILQMERLNEAFSYTEAELDTMLARFKDNEDVGGYELLAGKVESARRFTRGMGYTDFAVASADGALQQFGSVVKQGVWNYIDFWASWCAPCRAAIPAVKRLYAEAGEKLNVVSVSVDKKTEDWLRAVEQEQMPWTQVVAAHESLRLLKDCYRLSSIPLIIVIDPEGRIQMATHIPAEADKFVMERLRE